MSNGSQAKFGTITSKWEHFSEWKKIDNEGSKGIISADTLMKGMCKPENLLDIIENYTLYQDIKGGKIKICGKNHHDIDILLIYSVYSEQLLENVNYIYNTLNNTSKLPVDLTVLSVAEEKELQFLKKQNTNYLKIK